MKKRQVIATLLAAVGLMGVLAGCGTKDDSNKSVYKIGVTQIQDHPSLDNCRNGFIEGLASEGFVEGKNLEIEFKSAQGDMNMQTQIAQSFASANKDLVCGIATPSAQAVYAASYEKKIPVIFNAVCDPVEAKLAVSKTEPMDGITGVSDLLPVEDQLKLIREILPNAKKIGILYTTSEANSISTLRTYKELAGKYGFEIVDKGIAKQAEIPQALDVLLPQVDCISNMTDNTVVSALGVILDKANAAKIPVFGSEEEQVINGCLASAGLDYVSLGNEAGKMAARVLKGEDIKSIPYLTIENGKITVNPTVAQNLNITISDELMKTAEIV